MDTRTRGVDIVGSWRTELSGDGLDLTLRCNYNETDILNTRPNPAILARNGLNLQRIDRVETGCTRASRRTVRRFLAACATLTIRHQGSRTRSTSTDGLAAWCL